MIFFGLAAKESREPETRELPRRILFRGKLKSGEWARGNLNVDSIVGNIYDNPDLLKQGEDTQK